MLRRGICVWATIAALVANDLPLQLLTAADWPWRGRRETAVDELAEQIDDLERHIDTYGTIVAKSPDVWGQARLTKYRREYEDVLDDQLKLFKTRLNGAISRSDQAFLASALAMQAAVSGPPAVMQMPQTTAESSTLERIEPPDAVDASKLVGDPNVKDSGIISRTGVRTTTLGNFALGVGGIGLEPTVELDQLSRYLNHLHELRRINDGDDSADAPGYAMHLVRMPISVLPGEATREGYGAEVTIIARPNIHDDLLPQTFRQLVINDLVDQLAYPLAKFLDSDPKKKEAAFKALEKYLIAAQLVLLLQESRLPGLTPNELAEITREFVVLLNAAKEQGVIPAEKVTSAIAVLQAGRGLDALDSLAEVSSQKSSIEGAYQSFSAQANEDGQLEIDEVRTAVQYEANEKELYDAVIEVIDDSTIPIPAVSIAPSRKKSLPFPPSHLIDVYGAVPFLLVAKLCDALKSDEANQKHTLLLDLQKVLSEELHAGYDYLDQHREQWNSCDANLARLVREDNARQLAIARKSFLEYTQPNIHKLTHTGAMAWMIIVEAALLDERLKQDIHDLTLAKNSFHISKAALQGMRFCDPAPGPDAKQTFNEYVAARWPIHVVAVDPITQDQNIADTFSQRREMQLALALAMSSGRIGANSFTRMARRLEIDMETIALNRTVIGFSHGDDTFGWRFYPRFQSPDTGGHLQTFAVDMFKGLSRDKHIEASRLEPGIREVTAIIIMPSFVPYVTFDVRSNWFELTDPSRKVLTMQDTMELSADIMSLRQLSATCVRDAHMYRADDLGRMDRAVEALERRLPLQTSVVQMPFENTLGGFEFFNTGVPDLAPELKGFYGEPGIRVKAAAAATTGGGDAAATPAGTTATATATTPVNININGAAATVSSPTPGGSTGGAPAAKTSIFLVGDHFSVHETDVIVGNRRIPDGDRQLLSRQIMRIDVPESVQTVSSNDRKFVDIHVATPYGISNHLLVPVVDESNPAAAIADHEAERHFDRFKWSTAEIQGCFSDVNSDGTIELTLHGEPKLAYERQADLPAFQPTHADVAFWIDLIDKAGKKKRVKKGTAPIALDAFDQKGEVKIDGIELAFAIEAAVNQETDRRPQDVAAIELTGFARCREDAATSTMDALPIVKTASKIVIKIVPCQADQSGPTPTP